MKKILIAAGGTGGHIMPALAVAEDLRQHGVEIHWLGTAQGLEKKLVSPTGIPIHEIVARGIRKKSGINQLTAPFYAAYATIQAMKIIHQERIQLVMGFGGFVSAPGGVAAILCRKPLIIHEQNAVAGLTNRILNRWATFTLMGFPNAFPVKPNVSVSGNPVRHSIAELPAPDVRFAERHGKLRLLILGGSQGAHLFNQTLPEIMAQLPEPLRPEILHSAGKQAVEQTQAIYARLHLQAQVTDFIDDMARAYAWADFAICRAGALTLSELTAAGLGSILVPYPFAVDDHQTQNARHLADAQAAFLIPQSEFKTSLLKILSNAHHDRNFWLSQAKAARHLAKPDATKQVTEACLNQIFHMDSRRKGS